MECRAELTTWKIINFTIFFNFSFFVFFSRLVKLIFRVSKLILIFVRSSSIYIKKASNNNSSIPVEIRLSRGAGECFFFVIATKASRHKKKVWWNVSRKISSERRRCRVVLLRLRMEWRDGKRRKKRNMHHRKREEKKTRKNDSSSFGLNVFHSFLSIHPIFYSFVR